MYMYAFITLLHRSFQSCRDWAMARRFSSSSRFLSDPPIRCRSWCRLSGRVVRGRPRQVAAELGFSKYAAIITRAGTSSSSLRTPMPSHKSPDDCVVQETQAELRRTPQTIFVPYMCTCIQV